MKIKSFSSFSIVCMGLILFGLGGAPGASPLLAQDVTVEAAIPDTAAQGTVSLNVTIKGSGYKKGARAQWFVSGTTNPGGVTVNSTTFVSGSELLANITVAADAQTDLKFDVVVYSAGRTGKGIELFSVTAKGSADACVAPTPVLTAPALDCYLASGAGCLDTTFGTNGLVITNTSGSEPLQTDFDIATGVALQTDGKIIVIGTTKNTTTGRNNRSVVRYNFDGTLDTAFGASGIVTLLNVEAGVTGGGVAIQLDGKIVVSGDAFSIARLNPDGTLDTTFGTGGVTAVTFTYTKGKKRTQVVTGPANDLAVQQDGKIVAVGTTGIGGWAIARLNPDGSLDSTFGGGGTIFLHGGEGGDRGAYAVVLQPVQVGPTTEYRILVGGAVGGFAGDIGDFALKGFTPSGSLDTSFGPNGTGMTQTDICSGGDRVYDLALDAGGNIIASGYANYTFDVANFAVARYDPNGVLDTSFGDPQLTGSGEPTGKTVISFMGGWDIDHGLVLQPDGKIILSGGAGIPPSVGSDFFGLARFNTDGTLDTTFGTGGVVTTDTGFGGRKAALQPDGKIVVVGSAVANGGYNFVVARYWP